MREAASRIDHINESLSTIGFEKESVKTTDFNVRTDYESKKDRNGNYYRVFNGYVVNHRLKVSFDFNTKVLSKALGTIAGCIAEPELSISFTVKEPAAVNEYTPSPLTVTGVPKVSAPLGSLSKASVVTPTDTTEQITDNTNKTLNIFLNTFDI